MVFAKNSGIGNISEFSNCVGSHKYSTLVYQSYDLAISLGHTMLCHLIRVQVSYSNSRPTTIPNV
jgi:hypothetical protein